MINIELNSKTSSKSPLSISPMQEDESSTLSFSSLLKGINTKDEKPIIQNGLLVLSLEESLKTGKLKGKTLNALDLKADQKEKPSKNDLLSLLDKDSETAKIDIDLKADSNIKDILEKLELNPKITADLSPKELKVLVKEAKQYLKNKIIKMEGFNSSDAKKLPKTLKGLAQVAQKLGIDVSKITFEEVKGSSKKILVMEDAKALQKELPKTTQHQKLSKNLQNTKNLTSDDASQELLEDQQKTKDTKEIKSTPLFKTTNKTKITTQELISTKKHSTTTKQSTPKEKADETLKMLLQGKKTASQDGVKNSKTKNSSELLDSAKTIAAEKKEQQSLESLLSQNSDSNKDDSSKEQHSHNKNDFKVLKADSFEVKLNEAKQMTKYLSQDVKKAIDNYKSPFTRIKIQLNPQRLGEVDLTIVQRGKNLHVNISSNNAAINTLAMNANDLKIQLNNNGINNATLNFSNNSQNGEQSANQHQQNHQHNQKAQDEYGYYENDEHSEDISTSLEIIVPYYA